jgi:hypothetical protein
MAQQFFSVMKKDLPLSGNVGNIYYCTDTLELFLVVGDNSLVELLSSGVAAKHRSVVRTTVNTVCQIIGKNGIHPLVYESGLYR